MTDKSLEERLLPCPFCGRPAHIYSHTHHPGQPDGWCVMCNNMGCVANAYVDRNTQEDAITAWNTRHQPQEVVSALADQRRLREARTSQTFRSVENKALLICELPEDLIGWRVAIVPIEKSDNLLGIVPLDQEGE